MLRRHLPVQITYVEASLHGPQDDVFGDQVERGHLLLGGERRQQMAVHRVHVNRVLALWGKTDFRMCWTPVVAKIIRAPVRSEHTDL